LFSSSEFVAAPIFRHVPVAWLVPDVSFPTMYIADMLSTPNTGTEPSDNDLMQCRAIAKIAQVAADTCITDSFHDSRLRDALTGEPVAREIVG